MQQNLHDYLESNSRISLILLGRKGMPMLDDALELSAKILNVEKAEMSPDFKLVSMDKSENSIGVDKAQEICDFAMLMPTRGNRKVVVVDSFNKMTSTAMNSLLKLLEDSITTTLILVCYEDTLLPTIKSRCRTIKYEGMNYSQYLSYCKENNIPNAMAYFYITGGNVNGIASADQQLITKFINAENSIKNGRYSELLGTFNLVKEKDSNNFFITYKDYVPSLISFIGNVLTEQLLNSGTDEIKHLKRIETCRINRNLSGVSSYTKDNFFNFVISLIETQEEEYGAIV